MSRTTVLTLVGSLRADSINKKLAEAAATTAPEGVEIRIFDGLGDLPFYNEDLDVEGSVPESVTRLREAAKAADSILLVSPEYNGTIPAVLKNAIDWLSRPYGQGALTGKPAAVIGTAFGQYGGQWAHDDARKSLKVAGAHVVESVSLSVPNSVVRYAELHPKDDAEVLNQVGEVVATLASADSAATVAA